MSGSRGGRHAGDQEAHARAEQSRDNSGNGAGQEADEGDGQIHGQEDSAKCRS